MHLSSASPRGKGGGGGERIVHFEVPVFPHPWVGFFLQSPQHFAKPSTQLVLKMHFRTLFWFFEELANTWTLHSDDYLKQKSTFSILNNLYAVLNLS